MMNRRNMFGRALAGASAWFAASAAQAGTTPTCKVVYHLVDFEKVDAVLGNIRHHYEGVGVEQATIALVVHGPALRAFAPGGSAATRERLASLLRDGLASIACANTLRGMAMGLKDLPPGFALAEKGGVVRIVELQQQGYFYIRP
jgi:uncharacterized protein